MVAEEIGYNTSYNDDKKQVLQLDEDYTLIPARTSLLSSRLVGCPVLLCRLIRSLLLSCVLECGKPCSHFS